MSTGSSGLETVTLGGGCFWCVEAVFERLAGVARVESGYAGGHLPDPTYRAVTMGGTGHAEVVRIEFDPSIIPFRDLLEIFFATHDPTTPGRQGNDIGPQYRSIILYENDEQRAIAEAVVEDLEASGAMGAPIVTEIRPLEAFYPAEPEHQEYYRRNADQAYCRVVISPKVSKLRAAFADRLREGSPG